MEKNERYQDIPQGQITVNSKYCLLTITSEKPIYYAYLPLSEKQYTLKKNKLKAAELVDGKYVIDYSGCNPLKSYCIGIGTRYEDYIVAGFSYQYLDEQTYFVASKTGTKEKVFKGNKYYQCQGSDFDYIYRIDAYYASEVDTVSGVKFDANHSDGASGTDLIMSAKVTCPRDIINSDFLVSKEAKIAGNVNGGNVNGRVCVKKKSWTFPLGAFYTYNDHYEYGSNNGEPRFIVDYDYLYDFPYDFIWREKGQKQWLASSVFTGAKLKEYLQKGVILELRFAVVHDYRTNAAGKTVQELYKGIYGDRFGKTVKVALKKAKI